MKKLLFMLPLMAIILMMGCSKKSDYHMSRFLRPNDGGLYVYADQEWDSVSFETTESYNLSSNVSWFKVPDEYSSFKNPYTDAVLLSYAWLQFEPNTTGEMRYGLLHLAAGDYSVDATIIQLPFLNVTNPVRQGYVLAPLVIDATTSSASLAFTAYSNWSLSTDSDWLTFEATSGAAGERRVMITTELNTTDEDRTAKVLLTSRGVTQEITVTQQKPIPAEGA